MNEYKITGHTRMGCLLGSPVAHSLSPMMHNDSFRELGIDNVYLCFEILPEQLGETVASLRRMNTFGFNLTMPNKIAVIPYLDELSTAARLIGAVNTVANVNGRLIGHNTDGIGFMKSAREAGCDIKGREMTLLGCGGAAQAIAVQAALDGASHLHLACRKSASWEKAEKLVHDLNEQTDCCVDLTDLHDTKTLQKLLDRSTLLVNGTSVGMAPNTEASPLDAAVRFPITLTVSDVIYNPRRTKLLEDAAAAGCKTFNGMYMLLYQGEAAFKIWTGLDMPVDLIKERYFLP